jgi:hypothetical protein
LINGQLLRGRKPHLESVLAFDTKRRRGSPRWRSVASLVRRSHSRLARARHTVQVGEISRISLTFPESSLNRSRSSEMLRSSATLPLRVVEPVTELELDVHADDARASARRTGSSGPAETGFGLAPARACVSAGAGGHLHVGRETLHDERHERRSGPPQMVPRKSSTV